MDPSKVQVCHIPAPAGSSNRRTNPPKPPSGRSPFVPSSFLVPKTEDLPKAMVDTTEQKREAFQKGLTDHGTTRPARKTRILADSESRLRMDGNPVRAPGIRYPQQSTTDLRFFIPGLALGLQEGHGDLPGHVSVLRGKARPVLRRTSGRGKWETNNCSIV